MQMSHDQVLAVPSRRSLISMPIDTPSRILADALLLDPFVIDDGAIVWGGADEPDDFDP